MQELNTAEAVPFEITPTSLENVKKVSMSRCCTQLAELATMCRCAMRRCVQSSLKNIPSFKIVGSLDRSICDVTQPLTGQLRLTIRACVVCDDADAAALAAQADGG
jgi:hypothetical protein